MLKRPHGPTWFWYVAVIGYISGILSVWPRIGLSPSGRCGSFSRRARPATAARRSRPGRGCWCCCRCCPGRCRPPGPGGRDPRRRWTPCWSAPPTASTSPGSRHSASGWTLTGGICEWISPRSFVVWFKEIKRIDLSSGGSNGGDSSLSDVCK